MNDAILEKVRNIICEVLDDDVTISMETQADDVDGWDSLTGISILAAIQDEFGIKITTEEVRKLHNVGDYVRLISARLTGNS